MSDFKPIEFDGEFKKQFWEGSSNTFVRYWVYLQKGFEVVNNAKNYFLIIFGSFWTAKVIEIFGYRFNPIWTLFAGLIGFPGLILIGRWLLHRAAKPQEFMTTHKATITGYQGFNMQVRQIKLLEEINRNLKKLNNKSNN